MKRKKVILLLTVPNSPYCWEYMKEEQNMCLHFDSEGGYPSCDLGFTGQKDRGGVILKSPRCEILTSLAFP